MKSKNKTQQQYQEYVATMQKKKISYGQIKNINAPKNYRKHL